MVRIHFEKVKGGKRFRLDEGDVWVTWDGEWEKEFLRFVLYCYESNYASAVLVLGDGRYVFLTRTGENEYKLELKELSKEEYEAERDIFFGGGSPVEVAPDEIPSYLYIPWGKIAIGVGALIFLFFAYRELSKEPPKVVTKPIRQVVVEPLTGDERKILKIVGTREFLKMLREKAEEVRRTAYSRLGSVSLSWGDAQEEVIMRYSFEKEFLYPVKGAVLSKTLDGKPVWSFRELGDLRFGREDTGRLGKGASFEKCAELLLLMGATVERRGEKEVRLSYSGKASEFLEVSEALEACPVYLERFGINNGNASGVFVLIDS